jgi:C1A family cysteine protease
MPTPTTRVNKLELNDGVRGLGWRPDVPDYRDHEAVPQFVQLPTEVRLDTTANMPPVYDQGQLGSCTANALAAAVEFDLRRQALTDFTPSRLFIYYNERVLERTVDEDAGAEIRDGAKTLHRLGFARARRPRRTARRSTPAPSATAGCRAVSFSTRSRTAYPSRSASRCTTRSATSATTG